jgi:hypothetical protein
MISLRYFVDIILIAMAFLVGDLVKYKESIDPDTWSKSVIPPLKTGEVPFGIVVETRQFKTTSDDRVAGIVDIVHVHWFKSGWNMTGTGYSEEMAYHLQLIQTL